MGPEKKKALPEDHISFMPVIHKVLNRQVCKDIHGDATAAEQERKEGS